MVPGTRVTVTHISARPIYEHPATTNRGNTYSVCSAADAVQELNDCVCCSSVDSQAIEHVTAGGLGKHKAICVLGRLDPRTGETK